MNSWEELKNAVGQWASANFGSQNGLGCLAPLMGMCEEVGEYAGASTAEERRDACGDICIFLMDYCSRGGVYLGGVAVSSFNPYTTLSEAVGNLHHIQLKRLQRIRGMEHAEVFAARRWVGIGCLLATVNEATLKEFGVTAFKAACDTFTTVVQKRKWHDAIDKPLTVDSCTEDFQRVVKELNNL